MNDTQYFYDHILQIELLIEFRNQSMADLINHVKDILQISVHNQTEDLKRYQIQVCNKFLSIRVKCQEMFNSILQKWLSITFSKIIQAINQQQSNTIRKDIEEILIDVTIKQQFVLEELVVIERKFLNQIQRKVHMQQPEQKMKRQQCEDKILKPFYENKVNSIPIIDKSTNFMKGRSLSAGLRQKRSLSKISIFAESKKIETNFQKAGKLSTKIFQRQTNKTMKKSKKRQENCFTLLEKTMSNTSPSNFKLNYMNRQQKDEKGGSSFVQNNHDKSKVAHQKQFLQIPIDNLRESSKVSESLNYNQNKCQHNIQTAQYQKLVFNLEEKITQKFDQLMDKYSKKQKKIITQQLLSNQLDEKSKIITMPISIPFARNIKTSEIDSSIQQIQKCQQVKSIERVSKKIVKQSNAIINQGETDKKIKNEVKVSIKSINIDNKIVRNKKGVDKYQESIEIIKLQKQKQIKNGILQTKQLNKLLGSPQQIIDYKNLGLKIRDSTILKPVDKIILNKQYIQTLILQFEKITGKLLLPISKKLLHSLMSKYQTFCKRQDTIPLASIMEIEVEKMQMQQIQLKGLVMKMQKMLKLKCEAEKRQKIKLYINSFLRCWLSFNEINEVVVQEELQVNEETIKDKIKEVIRRLNN